MPIKMLEVWSTAEIIKMIDEMRPPLTERNYMDGYSDALAELKIKIAFNNLQGKGKKKRISNG